MFIGSGVSGVSRVFRVCGGISARLEDWTWHDLEGLLRLHLVAIINPELFRSHKHHHQHSQTTSKTTATSNTVVISYGATIVQTTTFSQMSLSMTISEDISWVTIK